MSVEYTAMRKRLRYYHNRKEARELRRLRASVVEAPHYLSRRRATLRFLSWRASVADRRAERLADFA